MKKFILLFVGLLAFTSATPAFAITLFSDDFSGGTLDTTKWTFESVSTSGAPLGSVSQSGGQLDFSIKGGNYSTVLKDAYGVVDVFSTAFSTEDMEEVRITGKWQKSALGSPAQTAGLNLFLYDANNSSKYLQVAFSDWTDQLSFYDSGTYLGTVSRPNPGQMTDFKFWGNASGWKFEDNGTLYANYSTTPFDSTDLMRIKIGGQDAWYYAKGNEHGYFDDIMVAGDLENNNNAVPEPATMVLFGSGLVGFFLRRKKV